MKRTPYLVAVALLALCVSACPPSGGGGSKDTGGGDTGGAIPNPCVKTGYFQEYWISSPADSIATGRFGAAARIGVAVAGDTLIDQLSNTGTKLTRVGSVEHGFTSGNDVLLQAVDLDLDGVLEFVASDGAVRVLKRDPASGTYPIKVTLAGKGANGVVIGDLDGKNGPDLVTLDYGAVTVYLNAGNATFGAPVAIPRDRLPNPYGGFYAAGALGDLDGDGKRDLVLYEGESSTLMRLRGLGDGTFEAGVVLEGVSGAARRGALLADLDGDLDLDLAIEDASPDGVAVLLGNGNGTFAAKVRYSISGAALGLAVGDLDGDGHLDLAVRKLHDVGVLKGSGTGTFAAEVVYQAGAGAEGGTTVADIAVADLDGNGRDELLVASSAPTSKLSVLEPLASGALNWCCDTTCDPDYRNCGGDGCGGSCGTCGGFDTCMEGVCQCIPDCTGKVCGPDGCGGTCGDCGSGSTCSGGQCSCAGKCASCLDACSGFGSCCCGVGCMCDSDCTNSCGDSC